MEPLLRCICVENDRHMTTRICLYNDQNYAILTFILNISTIFGCVSTGVYGASFFILDPANSNDKIIMKNTREDSVTNLNPLAGKDVVLLALPSNAILQHVFRALCESDSIADFGPKKYIFTAKSNV